MQDGNEEKPKKGVLVPSRCLLPLSSPPSAHHLCLRDVGCFHSIKPFLAAATFPPDLGHVREGCSTGKCQIWLHIDDTNSSGKFLSALALDGDSKSLFCLRTGCWHLLSQCQLYSCLPQISVTSRGARPPLPDSSGTGSSCSLQFLPFFDRSAASGRGEAHVTLLPDPDLSARSTLPLFLALINTSFFSLTVIRGCGF